MPLRLKNGGDQMGRIAREWDAMSDAEKLQELRQPTITRSFRGCVV
jgi:hypothetical protein